MTHLFLVLLSLSVTLSLGAAPLCESISSQEVAASLKLQSFQCQVKTQGNCSYQECLGTLPSYPMPVLIVIPQKIESLRLHFHGHKLGLYPKYEKSLSSMLSSFELNTSLCNGTEVAIFPGSKGKCSTYDQVLKEKTGIEIFLKDIHLALGNNLKSAPLHISAHSGGGRVLSRFIKSGVPTAEVSLFDGIYSENQKNILREWYNNNDGKLFMATVKGMDPEKFTVKLKSELKERWVSSNSTIHGTFFDISKGDRFAHYSRAAGKSGSTKAHYDILTETWVKKDH